MHTIEKLNSKKLLSVKTLLLMLFVSSLSYGAEDDKSNEKDFKQLSLRYLAALQKEDMKATFKCWISLEQMQALLKSLPKDGPQPSQKEIDAMPKYLADRDKKIKERIPLLIKSLKEKGYPPKDLEYVSSCGRTRKKGTLENANNVQMVFKAKDGTLVELSVDDGFKLNGKWYFSDKPHTHVKLIKDGKENMFTY